jgi:hypothetical protein
MMAVCMLSIKLLSDDMAELAFQTDLFSCCTCFSDLEAADRISFSKPLLTTKNIGSQICMLYYETAGTLRQCSIQKQFEGPLMTITYGATLQTPQK